MTQVHLRVIKLLAMGKVKRQVSHPSSALCSLSYHQECSSYDAVEEHGAGEGGFHSQDPCRPAPTGLAPRRPLFVDKRPADEAIIRLCGPAQRGGCCNSDWSRWTRSDISSKDSNQSDCLSIERVHLCVCVCMWLLYCICLFIRDNTH